MMFTRLRSLVLAVLLVLVASSTARAEEYTYAIEINGVLCGYADLRVSDAEKDGRPYKLVEQQIFVMVSLFDSQVTQDIRFTYHVEPGAPRFSWVESHIEAGDQKLHATIEVDGQAARCNSSLGGDERIVELPDDVIMETPLRQVHLERDFGRGDAEEVTYKVFAIMETAVQNVTFTRVGDETIDLTGRPYECIVLDQLNNDTGVKARMWIDREHYRAVKVSLPNGRLVYLADPSVRKRIELADVNQNFIARANVMIPDVPGITYMKVKARFEPTGLWLEAADLNVPGQRFEGTVEDNVIEGVFEIEHARYDGTDAPPFPATYDEALAPFLAPDEFHECKDEVLLARARALTDGATDSWDAACRLSRWVAENIEYAIPGGGTPRKTYDIRAGECGAHSLLLATFCRSVGIPARVVWGCMYISSFDGAFGQHAWTEIYMGDAGWIPVDATAYETDYVDSGHIRVGEMVSRSTALNAKSAEIIEYRLASGTSAEPDLEKDKRYAPYVGSYDPPRGGNPFKVLIKDGALAVDIPGQVILPFNDPDEDGRWVCKLAPKLYCTFARDEHGGVQSMTIHEVVRMPRRAEPEAIGDDVPEAMRPYLGGYYFAAVQQQFTVIWDDETLAIHDPLANEVIHLHASDKPGTWIDERDKNTITFELNDGTVETLLLDAANVFRRK